LRGGDKLRRFGSQSALLDNRLRNGDYVVVEEKIVGARGLSERVYGGVAI
jgi:hypothetical protein